MSNLDIIRAWKDEEYRNSLSEEQRAQLPENPAGMVELSDEAMQNIGGGRLPQHLRLR
jgi:mersacidin/lichenicidin family type 2 lantibiotic